MAALVAGEGAAERVLDPATGESHRRSARGKRGAGECGGRRGRDGRVPAGRKPCPRIARRLLLKLADRIEADGAAYAKLESDNTGKPLAAALNDEIPAIADVFRFFAGAARVQHGALAGEYLPGLHQHDPARSGRRRRIDRALELSVDDGRVEARAGARGRQHGRAEAVRADAADGAEAGGTAGRALSQRRRQRHLRPRRERRRAAGLASARAHGFAHRRCVDRAEDSRRPRPAISSARIWNWAARRR